MVQGFGFCGVEGHEPLSRTWVEWVEVYPEGPYTLLLWNQPLEDHPHYRFGDLNP